MTGATPIELAHDERADLADLLTTLTAEQWDAPSLCDAWSVREVVAHMISFDDLGPAALLRRVVRGRLGLRRVNQVGVAGYAQLTPAELLAEFRRHLRPAGLTTWFGGRIGLLDGLVHHQDVRRALGMPRVVPAERLLVALPFARIAPPVGALVRARGLRLVATDLGWTSGRGPVLEGPAEAVLMAIVGRADALEDVAGPGRAVLAARMGG